MSKMASRFTAVTSEEISQINEEAVPEKTKKVTKSGMASVFIDETGEKVSRLQMQMKSFFTFICWQVHK